MIIFEKKPDLPKPADAKAEPKRPAAKAQRERNAMPASNEATPAGDLLSKRPDK